jgi:hypothetical protein
MRTYMAIAWTVVLSASCGPHLVQTLPDTPIHDAARCTYEWREGDGWAFIAWALDIPDGVLPLALQAGYMTDSIPEPGTRITLPLSQDLSEALENRLQAARIVRDATEALESGDTLRVFNYLDQAMETDPSWSVPAYNASVLLLAEGRDEEAVRLLDPWSYKYDAALVQSSVAWNRGDSETAMEEIEISLMDESPPFEVLAAAALIYTVTGNYYQANAIWRTILASPEADSSIRLMAARYALIQELRTGMD